MIKIHCHSLVVNSSHQTAQTITFCRKHRHILANSNDLRVKLTVYDEHILFECHNLLINVRSKSLFRLGNNIKFIAVLQTVKSLLQRFDHTGCDTENYLLGVFRIRLMNKHFCAIIIHGIEIVYKRNMLTGNYFFFHK